jgi:hypothetical protein
MRFLKIYALLTIYLFSCISIVIDFHFCGGELEAVALYHADEAGCCGEHESEKKDCCQDKLIVINTDDSEKNGSYTIQIDFVKSITASPMVASTIIDHHLVLEKLVIPINYAPPNHSDVPLFIKNKLLLI